MKVPLKAYCFSYIASLLYLLTPMYSSIACILLQLRQSTINSSSHWFSNLSSKLFRYNEGHAAQLSITPDQRTDSL